MTYPPPAGGGGARAGRGGAERDLFRNIRGSEKNIIRNFGTNGGSRASPAHGLHITIHTHGAACFASIPVLYRCVCACKRTLYSVFIPAGPSAQLFVSGEEDS